MAFLDSLDIAKRVCQHVGVRQIQTVDEDSKANEEITLAYDKLRRSELRRNVWRYAIRRVILRPIVMGETMIVQPADYSATTNYMPGSIVTDENEQMWVSIVPDNLGNTPGTSVAWDEYFGPLTVSLYDSTAAYFTGELVYKAGTYAGSFVVYMSLEDNNDEVPTTVTAYSATTTYSLGDRVTYGGLQYRSIIPFNLGVTPADAPAAFDIAVNYDINNQVTGSDGFIYTSLGASNLGHDPITDAGVHWSTAHVAAAWASTPLMLPTSQSWLPIIGDMTPVRFFYPIGIGPSTGAGSRSIYRLPAGFLREAPQDPKAGSTSFLGGPSALAYKDWDFEGDFIVSRSSDIIMLRFVADVTDVSKMDDMFCEGLAATIALAVCEPLTQSTAKLQNIGAAYKTFMGEARMVNGIETGPTEPPEDDYISCRL